MPEKSVIIMIFRVGRISRFFARLITNFTGGFMKRDILLVLSLALIWGPLYSQEVRIGTGTLLFEGKAASGIFFDADDAPKENELGNVINNGFYGAGGRVYMWNESDTKTGLRGELSAKYTNGNMGFRIRLRADYPFQNDPDTLIGRYAYGWLDLFDNVLKFTGGFIDLSDNVWGTLGDGDWDIGGNGLRIEFKPFSLKPLQNLNLGEFNAGVFFLVPKGPNTNKIHNEDGKEIAGDVSLERMLHESAFGFRWTHPWFYAGAQIQLDSVVDGKEIYDSRMALLSGAGDEMRLMFGAGFTLLPELLITAEGDFNGLGNWSVRGTGDLRQIFQYELSRIPVPVVNQFALGFKAKELLWGYKVIDLIGWPIDLKPWIQIKPFISFKATEELSAGLEFGYGFGHLVLAHPTDAPQFVYENANFYIKPNLKYRLKNGLEIQAWYMFNHIAYGNLSDNSIHADRKSSYNIPKEADDRTLVEALIRHQIALEFVWTF
jgi:hypothetical protein